jgi:hypothetical protein
MRVARKGASGCPFEQVNDPGELSRRASCLGLPCGPCLGQDPPDFPLEGLRERTGDPQPGQHPAFLGPSSGARRGPAGRTLCLSWIEALVNRRGIGAVNACGWSDAHGLGAARMCRFSSDCSGLLAWHGRSEAMRRTLSDAQLDPARDPCGVRTVWPDPAARDLGGSPARVVRGAAVPERGVCGATSCGARRGRLCAEARSAV